METLKQHTARWWPAVLGMARYVMYSAILTYHQWHVAMKDSWDSLTSWDQINVSCAVVLNMLVAIGAIMNGSWQKAKDGK